MGILEIARPFKLDWIIDSGMQLRTVQLFVYQSQEMIR